MKIISKRLEEVASDVDISKKGLSDSDTILSEIEPMEKLLLGQFFANNLQ